MLRLFERFSMIIDTCEVDDQERLSFGYVVLNCSLQVYEEQISLENLEALGIEIHPITLKCRCF